MNTVSAVYLCVLVTFSPSLFFSCDVWIMSFVKIRYDVEGGAFRHKFYIIGFYEKGNHSKIEEVRKNEEGVKRDEEGGGGRRRDEEG